MASQIDFVKRKLDKMYDGRAGFEDMVPPLIRSFDFSKYDFRVHQSFYECD